MKRILALLLCGVFLLSMAGCRRRIMEDAAQILSETFPEDVPDPNVTGEDTVPEGQPDEALEPEAVWDATAPPVDEEIAAQGGETLADAPEPPEKGEEITVTLDPNGGECSVRTMQVNVGAAYGELPTPVRPGYDCKGWFTEAEGGFQVDATTVVTIREDHTLYAQWSAFLGYTVTFDPNGGRLSPYHTEKRVYPGEAYGELPTPYRDGYVLTGWFTAPEGGEEVTADTPFRLNTAQTLYAQWAYSPLDYWAYVLENTTQKIFSCQETFLYLELEADGVTIRDCGLISRTGSQNVAQNREDPHVDDHWVLEKNPAVIVKITADIGAAEAIQTAVEDRFPGKQVLVFPTAAVEGSEAEQLYYALTLATLLYPEYFYRVDLDAAAGELGVSGTVHK